jgi:transposase
VFRRPDEKYKKECIHGVTKGPGIKLMVRSCIWGCKKGPLIPILEKRVDRWVYIGIPEDGLLDAHQEVHDTIGDPVFQQDNARIHTATDTMAWFEEHNIQVIEWLAASPNLNPIEHCWKRLKETMHQHYPDIAETPGGPVAIKRRLAEVLNEVWTRYIEGDFLEKLWESMPHRMEAVIQARGWYTRY